MTDTKAPTDIVGPNEWVVDEMYRQYRQNPASVSEAWQDFFADYQTESQIAGVADASPTAEAPPEAPEAAPKAASPAKQAEAPTTDGGTKTDEAPEARTLRGAGARIVANMEASLEVPTATSYRQIPAKLLEVNRSVINGYLRRTRGGKISYTHLIGYAIVKAIVETTPVMNSSFTLDANSKPAVVRHAKLGLGLAVDIEKSNGSRTLLVPCISDAGSLDFRSFVAAYEDMIRKVRASSLSPEDFAGTTVTLTNPGTIGTLQSVPRLMKGQGLIVGVGAITFPAEFSGSDPDMLADFGVSKVITISSTYDHRIIQGAESGLFLKRVHELLLGEDNFYVDIFSSMEVPYDAVKWLPDHRAIDRDEALLAKQSSVNAVINMYRVRGHLIADLDPLRQKQPSMPAELDPASYGLTIWDLDREFLMSGYIRSGHLAGHDRLSLGKALGVLRDAYCRSIGIEYMHIQEPAEKLWIQEQVEGADTSISSDEKHHILERLNAAEALEKFLATKYLGQKRFGIEGAESAIPLLDAVLGAAADDELDEAVIGMAHRGRLNVLVNIVGKPYDELFKEFEGYLHPERAVQGSGDVKYHLGQRGVFNSFSGSSIPVELAANPSHLEAVGPVVEGIARAKQDVIDDPESYSVLPVLIHGDAAFAGQGVVAETFNCSQISGYRVGGTVHVIINNQLGYTTAPHAARSSQYSTDIAKMVQAPILHVNGDDPEACVRVARLAYEYRKQFAKDVVIDMVCYRREGHNEGDDPSYTQPLMYRKIDARRSVRKLYTETLIKRGDLTIDEATEALEDFRLRLQAALDVTRAEGTGADVAQEPPTPKGVLPQLETAISTDVIDRVFEALGRVPEGFTVHPKLMRQFEARNKMFAEGEVDWALGEALAFGSVLASGTDVRLCGQDSRRGTFAHRHATLIDYETGDEYFSLAHIGSGQGRWFIYDSLLSEYAALGFEYGYAVTRPEALVLWEAQFGDFVNGAQIIIDQFLVASEDKWHQQSGLVLLLPHGYEGQGPEHSSARIERFLTACAEDNIQVAVPSNAAQIFHLIRRQHLAEVKRPLIICSPKSLLRDPRARSTVGDLTSGTFEEVLADVDPPRPDDVSQVVLASGKVAHEAMTGRTERGAKSAIIRIEQLYPWPFETIASTVAGYPNATEIVWLQEEPHNMGAWHYAKGKLFEAFGSTHRVRRVSRSESGSPATGSSRIHLQEQAELFDRLFETASS